MFLPQIKDGFSNPQNNWNFIFISRPIKYSGKGKLATKLELGERLFRVCLLPN